MQHLVTELQAGLQAAVAHGVQRCHGSGQLASGQVIPHNEVVCEGIVLQMLQLLQLFQHLQTAATPGSAGMGTATLSLWMHGPGTSPAVQTGDVCAEFMAGLQAGCHRLVHLGRRSQAVAAHAAQEGGIVAVGVRTQAQGLQRIKRLERARQIPDLSARCHDAVHHGGRDCLPLRMSSRDCTMTIALTAVQENSTHQPGLAMLGLLAKAGSGENRMSATGLSYTPLPGHVGQQIMAGCSTCAFTCRVAAWMRLQACTGSSPAGACSPGRRRHRRQSRCWRRRRPPAWPAPGSRRPAPPDPGMQPPAAPWSGMHSCVREKPLM